MTWLAKEAHEIHHVFKLLFYGLVFVLMLISIIMDFFKLPLGDHPIFPVVIPRAIIASLLLTSYPFVSDTVATLTDMLAQEVGDMNQFDLIRERLGEKFSEMGMNWFSVKDSVMIIISYISFVLFHFSYYVAEGFLIYSWVLLYVFSPLLIALFVLPATAGATRALYRSMIEVSCWKVVWAVLATLLWSAALGEINQPKHEMNFLSVMTYSLLLAGSLLLTPLVVHFLAGAGISSLSRNLGTIGLGATALAPNKLIKSTSLSGKRSFNLTHDIATKISGKYFPKAHTVIKKVPQFFVPSRTPLFKNDSK